MKSRVLWFTAFTAVFAAAAVYIFLGTWSTAVVPVMPDAPWNFRDWSTTIEGFVRNWFTTGKFVPDDLKVFLASPWTLAEFQYVFAAYMAALGMAYFLRGKGLSLLACYGAGLLLAFSGYWFSLFSAGHLGWFRWMTYGVFAFGLIDRCLPHQNLDHRNSSLITHHSSLLPWALLGAVVAWGSFYQPDLWLLFTVFTGVYFVWRVVENFSAIKNIKNVKNSEVIETAENAKAEKGFWVEVGKGVLVAGVVFVAIGAPSFYNAFVNDLAGRDQQIEASTSAQSASPHSPPTAAQKGESSKNEGREERWIFVTNWSLPPAELAEAFVPRLNGDTSCVLTQALGQKAGTGVRPYTGALGRPLGAPQGNYRQHSLYIGFVTCLLALLAIGFQISNLKFQRVAGSKFQRVAGSKSVIFSDVFFFAACAALFFALACGRYFEPLYRVVFALPFGDYLRAPVKWYHLAEFCVCVLAGFGIDAVGGVLSDHRSEGTAGNLMRWIPIVLILVGVVDLSRVNRKYCAPVDMRQAQAKNANMQMTFLRKQDFNNPQIAQMTKAGYIQSLAYYPGSRDVYLVGVLKPRKPKKDTPLPPWTLPTTLGAISLIATFGVGVMSVRRAVAEFGRKDSKRTTAR